MRELEQFLNVEAEWVLDRVNDCVAGDINRTYYQGRLDQLAQVRRFLGQPQIMREKVSEWVNGLSVAIVYAPIVRGVSNERKRERANRTL